MKRAKRFLGAGLLCAALAIASGCATSGGEGTAAGVPDYVAEPVELTETLSVGHVSVGYPDELESEYSGTHERIDGGGRSCLVTTGQFNNEDWSLVVRVDEYTGLPIEEARAYAEQEMALPDLYDELDDATKAIVDNMEWVSLEDKADGFVFTKILQGTQMAIFRYYVINEDDYAEVMLTLPVAWHEANPGFVDAVLESVVINDEAAGYPGDVWIPTNAEPIYVDEKGVTWGYTYHPEGEPEHVSVFSDMLYTQGDGGETGYMNMAEHDAAVEAARSNVPDEPGYYIIEVSSNLYGFLSDEVVGVRTQKTPITQPAETPEESANEWFPVEYEVSTTSDGRTWGRINVYGENDMEFVMASTTGRYGFIVAAERIQAEIDAQNAVDAGAEEHTVMLDVYLYDSDEVVGQYAVTLYA